MNDKVANILIFFIYVPLLFLISICFAWVPMIAWNHSLHQIWPSIPAITFWQAFWLCILTGYVINKPTVKTN